jgi:hypothetical protein
MSPESWLKIVTPAFPVGFTVFGVWAYFGENPVPLLPAPMAFWGLMICFYLFSHLYIPERRYPLITTIFATVLWLVASLTSRNLGKFLGSAGYTGALSVLARKDFWYAYICAAVAFAGGLWNFFRYEPMIVSQIRQDRFAADQEEG